MSSLSKKDNLLLKRLGIKALILFGSQAQEIANEVSDYDFFVISQKSEKIYDSLYDLLSEKINKLVDIDIVFDHKAPLELKNHVAKYGKVLYESEKNVFANFRQKTMIEYSDFAPLRSIFTRATLERISP